MRQVLSVMGVVLVVVAAAANAEESSAAAPLRVGAVLPLTGAWQSSGTESKAALELAAVQVNSYLAPYGHSLELVVKDSASSPSRAADAIKALGEEGVFVVIGPLTSNEAAVALPTVAANGVLLISPSSTAPSLAQPDNLLRLCPTDLHQAQALSMLLQREGITKVVAVHSNDAYGLDLQGILRQRLTEKGIQVLESVPVTTRKPDFAAIARELESRIAGASAGVPAGASVSVAVVLICNDTQTIGLINAIPKESPLNEVRWYGSDSVTKCGSILRDPVAGPFAAHVRLTGFTLSSEDEYLHLYAQLIMQSVEDAIGEAPTPYVVCTWDALWLVAETFRKSPDARGDAFKKALVAQAKNFYGGFGFSELDDNGDKIAARYALYEVKDAGGKGLAWRIAGTFAQEPYTDPVLTMSEADAVIDPEAKAPITIEALLPLSGFLGPKGQEADAALELALRHVNQYFAEKGSSLRFAANVVDTRTEKPVVVEAVQQIGKEHPGIVITQTTEVSLAALAGPVDESGISLVSLSCSAPSLARKDRIIRLVPNATHCSIAVAALMAKQGIENVVVLYRADPNGKALFEAFQGAFTGAISAVPYPPGDVENGALLAQTEQALQESLAKAAPEKVAVLVMGPKAWSDMLTGITPDGVLSKVRWYGSEIIAREPGLVDNRDIAAAAARVSYTCPSYGLEGFGLFLPQVETLRCLLNLHAPAATFTLNAYDALWIVARAYERAGVDATLEQLWQALEEQANRTYGLGGPTQLDVDGDRLFSSYGFYTVAVAGDAFTWKLAGLYRDAAFATECVLVK